MEYTALMHLGNFVDEDMLMQGIYIKMAPTLHDEFETIEALVKRAFYLATYTPLITEKYIKNLKKCTLVSVTLQINL